MYAIMKRRKMSALQKKYFGKRKSAKKKRVIYTARRRRYYGRARRIFSRARGRGSGSITKNALDGVIVGVAQSAIPDMIPMQDPLIALGVGWFRKNPTLVTLGGIQLGAQLGSYVGGGLGGLKVGGTSQV